MLYVIVNGLVVSFALVITSGTYCSLLLMMYAPRSTGEFPITTAQNWLQHSRLVLKPLMSCSAPKTSVVFAAELETPASFAVAPDTTITLARITAPANSQRRLPMYTLHSLSLSAGSPSGGACSLPRLNLEACRPFPYDASGGPWLVAEATEPLVRRLRHLPRPRPRG